MVLPGARVAVIGAGLAGATCARHLADAGFDVCLFDKSRGVGGRMATRRAEWADADGHARRGRFDHGAPGFGAQSPAFVRFVEQAARDGLLARWVPRVAPAGHAPLDEAALWVATPEMPALCRALAAGIPLRTGSAVDALRRTPSGWCLESGGGVVGEGFAAVVVAIPPPQAAALLQPHRPDWAQRAQALAMLPVWTLMAATDDTAALPGWDIAWPTSGPLAAIVRDDAKPGRERTAGRAHWVAHASAAWSRTQLEADPAEVQAALLRELARWLGRAPAWRHATVHRWRYASALRADGVADRAWWDAGAGIGVCGDALGGAGVEGAWISGHALADALIDRSRGSQAPGSAVSSPLAIPTRFG